MHQASFIGWLGPRGPRLRVALAIAAASASCSASSLTPDTGATAADASPDATTINAECAAGFIGPMGGACPAGVSNNGPCNYGVDQPCANTCGPQKSGLKNCLCLSSGTWSCPVCQYDPDPAKSYACYKRPATPTPCPLADNGMLIQSGQACGQATCAACGSETAFSYLDGSGIAKAGYCVCSSTDPATGKWSCGSAKEWPPACLTDR